MVAGRLLVERPQDNLRFLNRAISGNRIVDLVARWKKDCINLKPDVVSIIEGLNDTAHETNFGDGVAPREAMKLYRFLIDYTLESLPGVQIVIGDPFVFTTSYGYEKWHEEVLLRSMLIKEMVQKYNLIFLPVREMFEKALEIAPEEYWTFDGVHPTVAGQMKIAQLWLDKVAYSDRS